MTTTDTTTPVVRPTTPQTYFSIAALASFGSMLAFLAVALYGQHRGLTDLRDVAGAVATLAFAASAVAGLLHQWRTRSRP